MENQAVTACPIGLPVRHRSSFAIGLAAARANLLPAIILWLAGVLILVAWFAVPPAHDLLLQVGQLKERYGFAYSMIGMALFAGMVPFLMQYLIQDTGQRRDLGMLVFLIIFWAIKGIEVDAMYRMQSALFGDGHAPLTLIKKIAVDQFVYCPLWCVPTMTLATEWAQRGFAGGPLPRGMRLGQWYQRNLVPVLVSNWCVSIPGVAVIYMMPPALQIPIQNLVVCLFVMLLLFMTRHQKPDDPATNPCHNPLNSSQHAEIVSRST